MVKSLKSFFQKVDLYSLLLVVFVLWLLSLKNRQDGGMDDFDVFFQAGKRLLNGENIYGPPHYYNLKYFYSVLFAGIMSLMQGWSMAVVKWIWFVLNTALFVRVLFILKLEVFKQAKQPGVFLFLFLLLFGKIVLVNYTFNQISVLILWIMLEAYVLLLKGHWVWAILLLSLGINIKIMPIILAPYFIFLGKKPLHVTLLGVGALLLFLYLPAGFIGFNYNQFLIAEWWKTLNPVSDIHVMQTYEYGFTDLSSLLTKFLSAEPVYLEPQLNVADWSRSSLFLITNAIRAALLLLVLRMTFKSKFTVAGIDPRFVVAAAWMALIPLCFPHQREYSFMFSMPQFAVLMLMVYNSKQWIYYALFIAGIAWAGNLVWIDFAGETAVNIFKHYRLITMGMLFEFLLFVYMVSKTTEKKV